MRCHYYLVLLVAAAFFAGGNAAVATTDSQLSAANNVRTPTKRALRTYTEASKDGEERGFSPSISEGLTNWMKRAAPGLLKTDDDIKAVTTTTTSSDDAFKMLKLDDRLTGILSNPNLKVFAYFLASTEKAPSQAMITTIINRYGDDVVAKFLFNVKHDVKITDAQIKTDAAFLQGAQYVKWFDNGVTPNDVRRMLDLRPITWNENRYEQLWWEYVRVHAFFASKSNKPLPVSL
ncbi:hypothetical protein PC129_g15634 [Phytophthora cactorum]|uniref:RxLR effector protein n=1 Tax=Phytophthora cactorum TaxID=29920 RepID=A0A329RLN8_9STRA|nr:hypothetical protein Pcac1_g7345 [Phytophthora cactorum]KAG2810022.1 hypothetical protein PC111_g15819 [Phytophthora cactorum]KAG2813325.1 hypothetical protein PC112_g14784 [Phytophthora cactorum]KAG2852517.1 hypothetical protein PC113_g14957 [Phytophthora cactorum]KAG2895335.1 hypothetical protein PC114_g15516 [Phytophthora cactorum]